MLSTWLFIILFSPTEAQVLTLPSQLVCMELKAYTDNEIKKQQKLKGIVTGCFRNIGEHSKET